MNFYVPNCQLKPFFFITMIKDSVSIVPLNSVLRRDSQSILNLMVTSVPDTCQHSAIMKPTTGFGKSQRFEATLLYQKYCKYWRFHCENEFSKWSGIMQSKLNSNLTCKHGDWQVFKFKFQMMCSCNAC